MECHCATRCRGPEMGTGAHRNAFPQATSSVNSVWSMGVASAQPVIPRRRGHRLLVTAGGARPPVLSRFALWRSSLDISATRYYTSTPTGDLLRLPSLRIFDLRISGLRTAGVWISGLLGIPRLLRSSGVWIPDPGSRVEGIRRRRRIPRSARFPELWISEPPLYSPASGSGYASPP